MFAYGLPKTTRPMAQKTSPDAATGSGSFERCLPDLAAMAVR